MKFCIMAAGKGTRNNCFESLHKALLPLGNKATISHIINKVDKDIEIVIAVGYNSEQIKSYMKLVHSDRKITYVDVDNYDKPGSGPGYSLLCCRDQLQEPFILTSVDTIVLDDVYFSDVTKNWMGVSYVDEKDAHKYCLVNGDTHLNNLYFGEGNKVYIGMAGIYDYQIFWNSLQSKKIIKGECQVIHGFDNIKNIELVNFQWYDTGNNEAYEVTRKIFKEVVANKNNEIIFIENKKVIKFFSDSEKNINRIERTKHLNSLCPITKIVNENMYYYDYVEGNMLSDKFNEDVYKSFLMFCQNNLFNNIKIKSPDFIINCKEMYETKTVSRLVKMFETDLDKISNINNHPVMPIEKLLKKINWDKVYEKSIPSYFHGDLQPENIIYNQKNNSFKLIDWRESFGKSKEVGDVYYDLSKMYHGLLINGKSILNKYYDYDIDSENDNVNVIFYIKNNLVNFMKIFEQFCNENNYDWRHVRLLGCLHYLNICTLYNDFHEGKFGKFLFLLGKYLLTKELEGDNI